MADCPFYGYHWPENSHLLRPSVRAECGLDMDRNSTCQMEKDGREPDFYLCPLVARRKALLDFGKDMITFQPPESPSMTLAEWEQRQAKERRPTIPGSYAEPT